ncbi:hypothetical protein [Saccharococcus sp. Marseille-Q5394]|uniref:hypothetical protein n=1 Tax=Saccharococcus sp. Marseille-Q5394 TaxID=2972778 RepID=UPI0021C9E323|nr:hypothetical protein [Saccharococcus sp. Marseille-Q5394]
MKKELNLESAKHSKMIYEVVEQALKGISKKEIVKLRKICAEDGYEYCNYIKIKYIIGLGMLGLEYRVTQEVEEVVFFMIHRIIHRITITDEYDESELDTSVLLNIIIRDGTSKII